MTAFADIFAQLAVVLAFSAAAGAVALALRQPLIVAFIFSGVLLGPAALGVVVASDEIDLLARIGISVLLFVVGLRLDPELVRSLGPVALATGLGQVAFTATIGYALALLLGLSGMQALYVAVALTFSSTIIIVKLLSDKREIDSLHGRIAVGMLIVQDVLVIIAMIGLNALAATGAAPDGERLAEVLLGGAAFVAVLWAAARWVLPPLTHRLAGSQELLVLFAVAWAVSLAALGEGVGVSKEIGAFLAGISLATTHYREAIGARLVGLRDFLLLFFFVDLGARIELGVLGAQIGPAVALSAFVLLGNPLIVIAIMGFLGYRARTSFLAGLTVAQISEFSLILAALGLALGHVTDETLGLITLVGMVTIGASTYMILYSHVLYERLAPVLHVFERVKPYREHMAETTGPARVDVVLLGLGRYGGNVGRALREEGLVVLGVDFDPHSVRRWSEGGGASQYGDAEDPELPASLPLGTAKWVVCTVPDPHVATVLVQSLRQHGYAGRIALTAHSRAAARGMEALGADLVLLPFVDAANEAADELVARLREQGAAR